MLSELIGYFKTSSSIGIGKPAYVQTHIDLVGFVKFEQLHVARLDERTINLRGNQAA